MTSTLPAHRGLLVATVSVAALLVAAPALGQALPTSAVVTAGAASVQSAGGVLTVTQTTPRADLNWQTFDIGAGGKVVFAQPSSSSVAVNRVLSGGPSAILGSLEANGRVFLLNPNGVIFGQGAQVNVGGLVAAAGELSGDPQGQFQITTTRGGTVSNAGRIVAGGGVLLAGERVMNAGSGAIRGGGVTLAAGREASVALDSGGLVRLQVDQGALDAAAANQGVIVAPGGQVLLTARGVAAAVDAGGRISTDGQGGSITVDAGPGGRVALEGTLEARSADGRGGEITVLGGDIGVGATASLDASGATGGGSILVGGGAHGQGQPYNARNIRVAEGARFAADSDVLGDGGSIVVWADGRADITGAFTARGGRDGGHGGFVETSGYDDLRIGDATTVNTLAPNGKAGDWLLDPTTITTGTGSATLADAAGGASGAITIKAGTINAATSNVILAASDSITVNSPSVINIAAAGVGITFQGLTPGSAPNLGTFLNGSIATNGGAITINGALTLGRSALFGAQNSATRTINAGAAAVTITGAINSESAGTFGLEVTGGSVTLGGPIGATNVLASFKATTSNTTLGGNVTTQSGAVQFTGALTLNSDVTFSTASGALIFSGDVNSASGQTYGLTFSGAGSATFAGSLGATDKLRALSASSGVWLTFTGSAATVNTSNGDITVGGALTLAGASTTFSSGTGTVTFGGAVSSSTPNSNILRANADAGNTGAVIFAAGSSTVSALSQILVGAPGGAGAVSLAGTFSAYDAFTVRGAVTLTGATDVTSGATTFGGTINGAYGLTLTPRGGGAIALQGDIGTVTPLTSLSLSTQGGLGHTIAGAVITSGDQTYSGSGTITLGGAALISTGGNLSVPATLVSSGASAVVLGAGYSGYDAAARTLSSATSGASSSRVTLSGGFTSTSSAPLTVYARDSATVTGGLGSSGSPLGMLSFTAPTVTLGASGQPINVYSAGGLLTTGALTVNGGGTWSLTGSNPATARSVEIGGALTITGALSISAARDMQFASITGASVGGGSLTVSGAGGATPTFRATSITRGAGSLSSVTFNTPVSLGAVDTDGNQTYAMGGSFSGAYVSTAGTISLTADRSAGRYITLAGTSSISASAVSLSGTAISSGSYGLTLSAPSLTLSQAILGDTTLGAIGDLSLTSTGSVSFGSSAHAVSGTFSANVSGALTFRNSRAFSLGAISSSVTTAQISSDVGDIVVTGQVTPSGDLTLVAGENGRRTAYGQADSSGNIRLSGGGVTLTGGARGLLYSGSLSNSTGLADLVGSGRSRYYLDTANSYADATGVPTGTGLYALYREQPSARITAILSDGVTTYDGKSHTGTLSVSGTVMGDTVSIGTVSVTNGSGQSVSGVTGAGTYTFSSSTSPAATLSGLGYSVSQLTTFTLAKAPLTLTYTANAATSVYGQALATLSGSVTGTGFVNGETVAALSGTAAWSTTAAAGAPVGTYGITGSGISSSNYTITAVQAGGSYTITQAPLTITGATTSLTYNGATRTNTYTVSGLVGSDTVSAVSGLATATNAGTYADTLSGATGTGLGNYSISYVNGGLTIGKASLTITGATSSKTYSGLAQTNTYTVSGLVGGDTMTAVSGLATGTNAGSYSDALTGATGTGLGNYSISYVNGGLTIGKAPLTITGATATRSVTGSAQTNTYSITSGQLYGSDRIDSVTGLAVGTTAGTYADSLTAAAGVGLDNYQITFVNGALTLITSSRPALTITGGTTVLTYNGRTQTNTFSVSGLTGSDTVTGVSGLASGTGAGTYLDSLSNATGSGLGNYDIRYINGKLTIDPATLTLIYTANAVTSVYGQPLGALSGSVSGAGFVNGETTAVLGGTAAWSTTATSGAGAGTYAITGGGLTSSNYTITVQQGAGYASAYTITKAPLTITGASTSLTYNGATRTNTYTVSGLVGGDAVTAVSGSASGMNAGTYADTLSGATGSGLGNYSISYVNGGLTIGKASLTITGATATRSVTGSAQTNTYSVTSGQLFGSDRIDSVTGLAVGTTAGTYADSLTAAAGVGLDNYQITFVNGALTLITSSKPALTITGGTTVLTYNGRLQTNTFSVSGLTGSDTVTGVSGLASGTVAGTYLDSLSNATGSGLGNYDIRYINGKLTIDPATLTLIYTANAVTSVYGQPLGALSGSVSGAGFVNGETLASLGGAASWTTAATAGAPAGGYAITGGGLTSANYRITAQQAAGNTGAYTITRAPLTITGATRTSGYIGQSQVNTFLASGLVGADRIDGLAGLATGIDVGVYTDSLSGAFGVGLQNYSISYVTGSLTISRAPLTIAGGLTTRVYSGGNQTNVFSLSGLYSRDAVTSVDGLAAATGAGTYSDALSGATGRGLANYDITYVNGRLTIDPATLTLTYTANATSSVYRDPLAGLSGSVTASGFVGGDTIAVLYGATGWTTTAVPGADAGLYAINGGGLNAANYRIDARQAAGNATAYTIAARPITGVTGISVADKAYDASLTASADASAAVLAGVGAGDAVRLAPVTATFANAGPGVAIPVTITLNGIVGEAARNYVLVPQSLSASASIMPRYVETPEPVYSRPTIATSPGKSEAVTGEADREEGKASDGANCDQEDAGECPHAVLQHAYRASLKQQWQLR